MGDTLDSVVQNWSYSRPPSTISNPPSAPPPPKPLPAGLQTPATPQVPPVPPPPSGQADPSDPTSMPSSSPPPDSTPPLPTPPVPPTTPPPPAQVPDGLQPKTTAPGAGTPLAPALSTVAAKQPTDTGLPTPVTDTPRWQEMSPTQLYNPQFPPVAVAIGQPESGMQNIRQRIKDPVTGQLQPAGQGTGPASGYFQIEDGTWRFYAPKMGVDLTKWPTAMAAPPQVQWAVAQSMPLNRWSKDTYAGFRRQYPWANGNMTLGQINAQAGGTDEYGVPRQYLVAATEREAGARFQPDPSWNSDVPGMRPSSWDIPRIMSGPIPQILALASSLFARVPLINAIAAYGAMAKAQQNGQLLDYQMNKDKWQTALKEHNAMQTMEGQDVDEALTEYKDNPEDMKQAMMQIARRYNDPNLNMLAQQERFDQIEKLQKVRDKYNQNLQKTVLEQQKVADQQSINAAVAAKDAQFLKDHPDATPGEIAEAHVQNMGAVDKEAKPTAASEPKPGEYTWTDPDGSTKRGSVMQVPGKGLVDPQTGKVIPVKEGTFPNKVSTTSQQPLTAFQAPDTWEGAPDTPPPGADPAAWAMALDWAQKDKPPTGLSQKSQMYPQVASLLSTAQKALGIKPSESARAGVELAADTAAETAAARYFASGQGATQIRSLNTVADHLAMFRQYVSYLNNGDTIRANAIKNQLSVEFGGAAVPDYNAAKTLMADEVVRLLTNTGGTRGDRDDAQRLASQNFSPEQLNGVADTLQNFVRGRFDAVRQQFLNPPDMHLTDHERELRERFFPRMLTDPARTIFEGPAPKPPGGAGAPATAAPAQGSGDTGGLTVGHVYKDGKGNLAKYLGGDKNDPKSWQEQ